MIIYHSAEIEEYEESNSRVKLIVYKNWNVNGEDYIRVVTEIPDISRNQAEAAMEGINRSNPGVAGTIARLRFLQGHREE